MFVHLYHCFLINYQNLLSARADIKCRVISGSAPARIPRDELDFFVENLEKEAVIKRDKSTQTLTFPPPGRCFILSLEPTLLSAFQFSFWV